MSIPAVINDVKLMGEQLFDHTPLVQRQIETFVEHFEKNERHREFDGIIRASHGLVEARETNVEALFEDGRLERTTQMINQLTEKILKLTQPTYEKEHQVYLEAIEKSQKEYVDLCQEEGQKKMRNAIGRL